MKLRLIVIIKLGGGLGSIPSYQHGFIGLVTLETVEAH